MSKSRVFLIVFRVMCFSCCFLLSTRQTNSQMLTFLEFASSQVADVPKLAGFLVIGQVPSRDGTNIYMLPVLTRHGHRRLASFSNTMSSKQARTSKSRGSKRDRTGTRACAGHVHMRWSEGLEVAKGVASGNPSLPSKARIFG